MVLIMMGCSSSSPAIDVASPDALPDAVPGVMATDRFSVNDTVCTLDIPTLQELYPGLCPSTWDYPTICAVVTDCGSGGVIVDSANGFHHHRCDYVNGKLVAASADSDVLTYCGSTSFVIGAGDFLSCQGGTPISMHCTDGD